MSAANHGGGKSPFPFPASDALYHFGRAEPKIARARNGVLGSLERSNGVADGILPGHRPGIQRIVHIEYGALNVSDAPQAVLGYIGTQHGFGSGENDGVRMGSVSHFARDEALQKIGITVFLFQSGEIHRAEFHSLQRLAESSEIDIWRHFLSIYDAFFADVKGHQRYMGDARVSLNRFEDADQGIGIGALQGGRISLLRSEVYQQFDSQVVVGWLAVLFRGIVNERLGNGFGDLIRRDKQRHGFIFDGKRGFHIPSRRAEMISPVAHKPIDVIVTLPQVNAALQCGIALGVFLNGGHIEMLNEVCGSHRVVARINAKYDRESFAGAGQFAQGNRDIKTAVEAEIESQLRLSLRDGARDVLADFASL